jgi:hypothetical protein
MKRHHRMTDADRAEIHMAEVHGDVFHGESRPRHGRRADELHI